METTIIGMSGLRVHADFSGEILDFRLCTCSGAANKGKFLQSLGWLWVHLEPSRKRSVAKSTLYDASGSRSLFLEARMQKTPTAILKPIIGFNAKFPAPQRSMFIFLCKNHRKRSEC